MNMDLNDRDMLIRIEQKLSDSISNYKQMTLDLKEFLGKLETDSKSIVQLETNLKIILERQSIFERDFREIDKRFEEVVDRISSEETERISFENSVKGGQRAWKVMISIIAAIASLISILTFISTLPK